MRVARSALARLCALLALGVAVPAATQTGRNASAGVYSKVQAAHGAEIYAAHCAACHGELLQGIDVAPPLTGSRFLANWLNQPSDGLFTRIKTTMPQNDPGSLGSHEVAAILAYILQTNGFAAGNSALPTDTDELQQIRIDAPAPAAR